MKLKYIKIMNLMYLNEEVGSNSKPPDYAVLILVQSRRLYLAVIHWQDLFYLKRLEWFAFNPSLKPRIPLRCLISTAVLD